MLFENVYGVVDIKNQVIYLEDFLICVFDVDMKVVMVYKVGSFCGGYVGFDFKI